jgi:TonB family protein
LLETRSSRSLTKARMISMLTAIARSAVSCRTIIPALDSVGQLYGNSRQMNPKSPNMVTGGIVILAHLAAFAPLMRSTPAGQRGHQDSYMTANIIETSYRPVTWDTTPVPDIMPVRPTFNAYGLQSVNFEDEDENSAVIAAGSSPRLSRVQGITPQVVARQRGVQLIRPEIVVLMILILEDGRVGDVQVSRGSGDARVDIAAIEYARALRWIPGTKDHQPQAMRISFPVIFSPYPEPNISATG